MAAPPLDEWLPAADGPVGESVTVALPPNLPAAAPEQAPAQAPAAAARRFSVAEQAFIDATMPEESAGDPFAVSRTNARGLMQTVPSTALRPGFGVKPIQAPTWEEERRVGEDYNAAMFRRYDRDPILAAVAYNAGPTRLDKWLALIGDPRKGEVGYNEFLRRIPSQEARAYAPKVANRYADILATPRHLPPEAPAEEEWLSAGPSPDDEWLPAGPSPAVGTAAVTPSSEFGMPEGGPMPGQAGFNRIANAAVAGAKEAFGDQPIFPAADDPSLGDLAIKQPGGPPLNVTKQSYRVDQNGNRTLESPAETKRAIPITQEEFDTGRAPLELPPGAPAIQLLANPETYKRALNALVRAAQGSTDLIARVFGAATQGGTAAVEQTLKEAGVPDTQAGQIMRDLNLAAQVLPMEPELHGVLRRMLPQPKEVPLAELKPVGEPPRGTGVEEGVFTDESTPPLPPPQRALPQPPFDLDVRAPPEGPPPPPGPTLSPDKAASRMTGMPGTTTVEINGKKVTRTEPAPPAPGPPPEGTVIGLSFPNGQAKRATVGTYSPDGKSVELRFDDGSTEDYLTTEVIRDQVAAPPAPRRRAPPVVAEPPVLPETPQPPVAESAQAPPVPPVAPPPAQPAGAPAAPAEAQAGIPMMITRAMRAELRARGIPEEQIRAMTPAQAHEELARPAPAAAASPAAPADDWVPAAEPAAAAAEEAKPPAPVGFTTAKGSTYEIHVDGSTTRNKAFRPEHGEAEQGPQPPSEVTLYVTPHDANVLGEIQTQGGNASRIIDGVGDGRWGIRYTSGPGAGKFERRTVVTPQRTPAVGLVPVELWNGGRRVHFGNDIVSLRGPGEEPPATPKAAEVEAAAAQADPNPSDAKIEAGNYAKGHVTIQGLPITIENAKGSIRSGIGPDGKPWSVEMPVPYGYVKGTKGADKDHIDVFIGPNPDSTRAFIIDQKNIGTGKFDEHKLLVGFDAPGPARAAYVRAFSDGRGEARIQKFTPTTIDGLKDWLADGNTKKPAAGKVEEPPADEEPQAEAKPAQKPSAKAKAERRAGLARANSLDAAASDASLPLTEDARRGMRSQAADLRALHEKVPGGGRAVPTDALEAAAEIFPPPAAPPAPASLLHARTVKDAEAVTSTGRAIPVTYAIIDADRLSTSHHDDLSENKGYPQELQPRDRSRGATELQIRDMLNPQRFRPELLGPSPDAANGAPIVGSDGLVESGNMRVMALRRAYAENQPAAEAYRAYLADQGYPIAGLKHPLLVRINHAPMKGDERAAFAREANKPAQLAMSATERAVADAKALPESALDQARPGDLLSAGNRDLVRSVLRHVASQNEMGAMIGPDGALSQEGLRRVQGAILAKAYGDPSIIGTLVESTDGNYKAIGSGLLDAAPMWAKMRAAAAEGRIPAELDLTKPLVEAVGVIARARQESRNVAEYVKQRDIFSGDGVSPEAESLLRWMLGGADFTRRVGQAKIADAARYYAQEALKVQPGPSLFGAATVRAPELAEAARVKAQGREQAEAEPDLLRQAVGQPAGAGALREGADKDRREASGRAPGARGAPEPEGDAPPSVEDEAAFQRPSAPEAVFYSALRRGIEGAKQERAPAAAWKGMIRNMPGVKAEEVGWSGISEWLDQQKGPVTKAAVLGHLRENDAQLRDVVYGKSRDETAPDAQAGADHAQEWERLTAEIQAARTISDNARYRRSGVLQEAGAAADRRAEALEAERDALHARMVDETMRRQGNPEGRVAKFGGYTIPGGTNYREMLLTLPAKHAELPEGYRVERHAGGWSVFGPYGAVSHASDRGRAVGSANERIGNRQADYRGPHFDEPNVLAHVRMNDRTGPNGEKILHLEEIQSDLHQLGRRKGYIGQPTGLYRVEYKFADGRTEAREGLSKERADELAGHLGGDAKVTPEIRGAGSAPDLPFKTSWPELAMKRVLRYAAGNGYDRLTWTKGETQANRYDLSKHVDRIGYTKRADGKYNFSAEKGDVPVFHEDGITPDRIAEIAGKEISDKIVNGEGRVYDRHGENVTSELTGLDLKVGGEGMRAFYDKMLPAFMSKYGKKWGAKVGETEIHAAGGKPTDYPDFDAWQRAQKEPIKVHSVDITPAMRDSVMAGQPLFARARAAARMPAEAPRTALSRYIEAEPAPAFTAHQAALTADIEALARRMFPGARLEQHGRLFATEATGDPGEVFGAHYADRSGSGLAHVIALSLESPDPVGMLRHEGTHYLWRSGLLAPPEKAALAKAAAEEGWLERHGIAERYGSLPRDKQIEEAVAEHFAEWRRNPAPMKPSLVRGIFERVKLFLQRVGAIARRIMGRDVTADDVLRRVESGEVGTRGPGRVEPLPPALHRVWHGSPHEFDRFSTEHIGTGEGAQSYGWGLYFADRKGVAEHYRDKLSPSSNRFRALTDDENEAIHAISDGGIMASEIVQNQRHGLDSHATVSSIIKYLTDDIARAERETLTSPSMEAYLQNLRQAKAAFEKLRDGGDYAFKTAGKLYHVELAPKEGDYLDWDKPVGEQSPKVKAALKKLGVTTEPTLRWETAPESGVQIYASSPRPEDSHGRLIPVRGARGGFDVYYNDTFAHRGWFPDEASARRAVEGAVHPSPRTAPITGREAYQELAKKLGGTRELGSPGKTYSVGYSDERAASLALNEAGVPGLRYHDASSRGAGEGSHNYVIFDDKHASIEAAFQRPPASFRALNPEQRRGLLAAEELDRLDRRTRIDDGRSIVARNRAHADAQLSRPGDIVALDPASTRAYFDRRAQPPEARAGAGPIARTYARTIAPLMRRVVDKVPAILDVTRDFQKNVAPMAMHTASEDARATAKDFANSMRLARWEWNRIDKDLAKKLTPEQQRRMWDAADEESVLRQQGVNNTAGRGLDRLSPEERQIVEGLQEAARATWEQAKELGMVQSEGLPSYTPRMVVMVSGGDVRAPKVGTGNAGAGSALDRIGTNLRTSTPQMKHRKHLTAEETEEAAQAKLGEGATVARNIRSLPLATGRLQEAIAGRALIERIKEIGRRTGQELVSDGGEPGNTGYRWFTIDHPSFKKWRPRFEKNAEGNVVPVRDTHGDVVFERVPIFVRGDYEGPLRAVLSKDSGAVYNGLMAMKGKTMSVIMYSPLIHNAVEWGRALPAMPGKVASFKIYFEGGAAVRDPETMREAIGNGMVPIGGRGGYQDITSIMNEPNLRPGRSTTSQILGAATMPNIFDRRTGDQVKRWVDRAGDFWHNTLLWDVIAKLQAGLYVNLRDHLIEEGHDPQSAGRAAAHFANRYAGALPQEAMSTGARKIANLVWFSRSFTFGNLGAFKDLFVGLPKDVQAQIARDKGVDALQKSQSYTKRKAFATVALDVALAYVGIAAFQSAIAILSGRSSVDDEWHGYVRRLQKTWEHVKENPFDLLNPFTLGPVGVAKRLLPQSENEPGKEDRIFIGHAQDGTGIYAANPMGRIGLEFEGWLTGPLDMIRRKMSTIARPTSQLLANDAGFGHKIYDPFDRSRSGGIKTLRNILELYLGDQVPLQAIAAARDTLAGRGNATVNAAQMVGPLFGMTFSKGAPGGPAVGDMYRVREQHEYQVQQALPAIRRKIQDKDFDGAYKDMNDLGIPPGMQQFYVRTTITPGLRLTTRQIMDFARSATPDQMEQFQRHQREAHPPAPAVP